MFYTVFRNIDFRLELFKNFSPVLRIRDVYPGSWLKRWFLPIPDLGSKNSNKREVMCSDLPPVLLNPNGTVLNFFYTICI
jgi:hypothetical protein